MLTKDQFEHDLDTIFKKTNKNEKLAWNRKRKKLEDLVDGARPIEEAIFDLMMKKQEIIDQIDELRQVMVTECIHPQDMLVHHGRNIECKFCGVKILINRHIL